MKTTQITLKGWANNSDLMFSENSTNEYFMAQFNRLESELIANGFKRLKLPWQDLRGKNATEKIVVKGWYWRGSWSDPSKEVYAIFYK